MTDQRYISKIRSHSPTSELEKLIPDTLYLTFNAPEVNEYHRGLLITDSSLSEDNTCLGGTLFHAVYSNRKWALEKREVANIASSKTLVLMWKISTLGVVSWKSLEEILKGVEFKVVDGDETEGNPELGGYDCVLWTERALRALMNSGLVSVKKDARLIKQEARKAAGPEDATTMVGRDFGGVRVINETMN